MTDLGTAFSDSFNSLGRWVTEGSWTAVPNMYSGWTYQPDGLLPTVAAYDPDGAGGVFSEINTSNWVGNYWHIAASNSAVWTGTTPTFPSALPNIGNDSSIGEINFDYQADTVLRPFANGVTAWQVAGTQNHEYYLMRYQRAYTVATPATYRFRLAFAGGARLYLNGTLVNPKIGGTQLEKPFRSAAAANANPWLKSTTSRTYYYEEAVAAGNLTVRIEYYHTTLADSGAGRIRFDVSELSSVARTSAGSATTNTYPHMNRVSIILDGKLTIPAGQIGNVGYQERFSLTNTDYARPYISYDDGFTWTAVSSVSRSNNNPQGGGWSAGSTQDWRDTTFNIIDSSSGDGKFTVTTKVMIKFELDSRLDTAVDEGWLIDNFQFFTNDTLLNNPPISSTVTLLGTVNTVFSLAPTIVDPPGDTHTIEIVSQPDRGTVAVVGGLIQYTPPVESGERKYWTGITTFTYQVKDSAAQYLGAPATGTIYVEETFLRAFNYGPDSGADHATAITVNGNSYNAMWADSWVDNAATGAIPAASVLGSGDANMTNMLRNYVRSTDTGSNAWVGVNGTLPAYAGVNNDPAVYSVYLWVIAPTAGLGTFDIYMRDDQDTAVDQHVRVLSNAQLSSLGQWQRYGPFTVRTWWTHVSFFTRGARVGIAGMEVYRGAPHSEWFSADIGGFNNVDEGSTSIDSPATGSITVTSYGDDIWGTDDAFRYVYQMETGNVCVTARANWSGTPPDSWSKAGVMIRESTDQSARHAMIVITRDDNARVSFQHRVNENNSMSENTEYGNPKTRPMWLRMQKNGQNFTAYYSTDGITWTQQGSTTNIAMTNPFFVGLAVTSHNNGASATAVFDNITIKRGLCS
jgi:hypothetical protein